MPFHSEAGQLSSDSFCQYCNNVSFAEMGQKWSSILGGISIYSGEAGTMNARRFFASKHILLLSIVFIRW